MSNEETCTLGDAIRKLSVNRAHAREDNVHARMGSVQSDAVWTIGPVLLSLSLIALSCILYLYICVVSRCGVGRADLSDSGRETDFKVLPIKMKDDDLDDRSRSNLDRGLCDQNDDSVGTAAFEC